MGKATFIKPSSSGNITFEAPTPNQQHLQSSQITTPRLTISRNLPFNKAFSQKNIKTHHYTEKTTRKNININDLFPENRAVFEKMIIK